MRKGVKAGLQGSSAAVLAALIMALQTPPDTAISNAALWAQKAAGITPLWLRPESADTWVTVILSVVLGAVLMSLWQTYGPRQGRQARAAAPLSEIKQIQKDEALADARHRAGFQTQLRDYASLGSSSQPPSEGSVQARDAVPGSAEVEQLARRADEYAKASARERRLEQLRPAIEAVAEKEKQQWGFVLSCCREVPEDGGSLEHRMNVQQIVPMWRLVIGQIDSLAERITGKSEQDLYLPVEQFNPHQPIGDERGMESKWAIYEYRKAAHHRVRVVAAIQRLRDALEAELVKARAIIQNYE
jgi:hypothetical protein